MVSIALGMSLAPRLASADAAVTTKKSLADALFQEAQTLMDAGKHAEACPKLVESQNLDPSGGTLLHLAMCREGEGKTASAYALYKDALTQARRDGRKDRETYAESRLRALEPTLSRLTIEVAPPVAATPGLEIALDGQAVPRLAWGTRLAVDPGEHVVRATAPGSSPHEERVRVGASADARTVKILSLEPLAPADGQAGARATSSAAAPSSQPDSRQKPPIDASRTDEGSGQRALGLVLVGAGLAVTGAGAYFGVRALALKGESDALCPAADACRPGGAQAMDQANGAARFANVLIPVGAVAAAVGGYIFFSAPKATSSRARGASLRVAPAVAPAGAALHVSGRF